MTSDKRASKRRKLRYPAKIIVGGALVQCTVSDVSQSGAKLRLDFENLPEEFDLLLSEIAGTGRRCQLVWHKDGEAGVKFLGPTRAVEVPDSSKIEI